MKGEEILKWLDSNPSIQELKRFAKSLGLRVKKAMKKKEVIKLIKEHSMWFSLIGTSIREQKN
ncbi:MAG: hypothetical protein JG779_1278 [Thermotoga sp.]|nr:hypothetical protein [Thermotoga sp.]